MRNKILIIAGALMLSFSCTKILDQAPKGALSTETLTNKDGAEALVVSAYALLDQVFSDSWSPIAAIFNPASNWSYSDVRCGDAYKGGGGTGDIGELNSLELGIVEPTNSLINNKWRVLFYGVSRCNKALTVLNALSDDGYDLRTQRIAEVKVLRGIYYFELKKHFRTYPYIDETILSGQEGTVLNDLTEQQLWDKIKEDLSAGITIPFDGQDIGRINKYVAYSYLAKWNIYQKNWAETISNCNEVINSGKFKLLDNLQDLYSDPTKDHDGEKIFALETSVKNGGTEGGNYNWGDLLTSPPGPAYGGGDGFHRPTQNLVNAFKVDPATGLPLFDTYNNTDLAPTDVITAVDPRLDHAIGRPGIPWKDFTGEVYGNNWIREGVTYGPYSKKKNIILVNSPLRGAGAFPWAQGALNFPFIKYSDILLLKAEALIESGGSLEEAKGLINLIRNRAKDAPVVKQLGSATPAANYKVEPYPASPAWDQATARKALRFERRLELCLEGHRFYDLVRWGEAASVINNYYQVEKTKRPYLNAANYTATKHDYLPIPQAEIDISRGGYIQDPNY
ncbi:RagB/SusD family nutrient uptake outer membrane protein [Terrimonas pollutisoli]|uniref:RagB/SusD family nutrient uptake outer membrane protein n=1 Tax=Terrimonas pollutisoli TaxID=3034147 RepID=UPI0023ECFA2B|nr:RagB/SusD family nutrient uptake outer membrane protein [Terrimonas sp. H1YJ31]